MNEDPPLAGVWLVGWLVVRGGGGFLCYGIYNPNPVYPVHWTMVTYGIHSMYTTLLDYIIIMPRAVGTWVP